jgi:hypothetical protein
MSDMNNIVNYKASPAGLARIFLWTLFFLWLAGALLPPASEHVPFMENAKGTRLRPVATIVEDPRFIRDDLQPLPGRRIAWITDSTSAIFPPGRAIADAAYADATLVPALVLDLLNAPPRRADASIDLNIQLGMRSIESYSSVAAALLEKPDLVVLSFNPAWMLSRHEIHKRDAHLNRASSLWARHPESWAWLPLLASPANHAWAIGAQHLRILRQSALYKGRAEALLPAFSPGATGTAPEADAGKVQLVRSGVVFWVCFAALSTEECGRIIRPGAGLDNRLWYRELMKLADLGGDGFSGWAWRNTLVILRQSGIPTLIYAIPVPADLRDDPAAYEKMQRVHELLDKLRAEYEGTNIQIIPRIPPEVVKTARFRPDDGIHLVTPGKFDDYLADRIWHILQQQKKTEARP